MYPFWQMCHFPGLCLKPKSIPKSKETSGREELFLQALPHWFYPDLNKQVFVSCGFHPIAGQFCTVPARISDVFSALLTALWENAAWLGRGLGRTLHVQPPHSWFPLQLWHTEVLQGSLPWLPQFLAQGTLLKPPIKCLFCIWDPSVLTHYRNETLSPPVSPDPCLCTVRASSIPVLPSWDGTGSGWTSSSELEFLQCIPAGSRRFWFGGSLWTWQVFAYQRFRDLMKGKNVILPILLPVVTLVLSGLWNDSGIRETVTFWFQGV